MKKKALCVGINDYPFSQVNDLRGCVNDANDWATLLKDHFDFTDVKILLDKKANKANMLSGVKNLLAGAKSGDVLVFTNASHGTYRADEDGDEPNYDEAICPHDTDSNLIIDDDLRELFANIPEGVRLTVISDSCHSGSVTRVMVPKSRRERRNRELAPNVWGGRMLSGEQMSAARKRKRQQKGEKYPESGMKEILLSGCKSNQTSADAHIAGGFHGAMSYYAIQTIRDADYKLTYAQLHMYMKNKLMDEMYEQEPQLEGTDENKNRQIFT